MKKAICYVNQFFGGVGGEDKADQEPYIVEGCVGPTGAINAALADCELTHTVVCGDNFMGSHTEEAIKRIMEMLAGKEFDLFIAGPAFRAGRYGVACGNICKAIAASHPKALVITSMNDENPGVEMFKKDALIFKGGAAAAKMRQDVKVLTDFANKMLAGGANEGAEAEGYFPRGCRHEKFLPDTRENTAAYRGVQMLLKKMQKQPYQTELVIPAKDVVPVAAPVALKDAVVAMVTTGGIVPVDNPDRIQSASATRWGKYDVTSMDRLESGVFKTIHAGFDPAAANADPNVIVPLDAMRAYEKEGKFKRLHNFFYSTVGTGTTEAEAKRMATEIIPLLHEDGVNTIILGST